MEIPNKGYQPSSFGVLVSSPISAMSSSLAGNPPSRFNCFWLQHLGFINLKVSMNLKQIRTKTCVPLPNRWTFPATQWLLFVSADFGGLLPLSLEKCFDRPSTVQCLCTSNYFRHVFLFGKHRNFEVFNVFGAA